MGRDDAWFESGEVPLEVESTQTDLFTDEMQRCAAHMIAQADDNIHTPQLYMHGV